MSVEKMIRRSTTIKIIAAIIAVSVLGMLTMQGIYIRYVDGHHHSDDEVDALNQDNIYLQDLLWMRGSAIWVDNETVSQGAGNYTSWTFNATYAGYVVVFVHSSYNSDVIVRLEEGGAYFPWDQEAVTGTNGVVEWPVLPNYYLHLEIGNNNTIGGTMETLTVEYHY